MMKFESDLAPLSHVTVLPNGYEDQLDRWLDDREFEAAYGDWAEEIFDPDL
jgi:hypothetical protein